MPASIVLAWLAAAVALDAFVLRTALVPAVMHLLGRSNWWLPAVLEKRLRQRGRGSSPTTAVMTTDDGLVQSA